MVKLDDLLTQIQGYDGYIYARKRAEDHGGIVQCYTAWFQRLSDNRIRDFEVRILVINLGEENEDAYLYDVDHILNWITPPE